MSDKSRTLYPLSSPQREIWFDQMLHADLPLYNIGGYVKIPGPIDPALFERAVNLLVQKHDTLRIMLTEVSDEDGIPMQTYVENLTVTVPVQDFSAADNPHEEAMDWMQKRFVKSFELTGQPLFRYDLLKLSDDNYYWLLQYHHLIIDGYGVALLNRSLAAIYTQLADGQVPDPDSPSYVSFVDNDRAYVESAVFEKQRRYWLDKYSTSPEPLFSPRYLKNYTDKLTGSGVEELYLPRVFYNRLHTLAKQHNATLFHLLLGALYVYFTRTAGRDDFAVGLPVLNRANADFKKTAGLFTGVSPVRFDFSKDVPFAELLQQINKTLRATYRHQRFPISEINRNIGLEHSDSRLFDISLSYLKHDHDAFFNKAHAHTTQLFNGYEQTPLLISVEEFHEQHDVKFDFVYNRAYFTAEDIGALKARFVNILEAVLEESLSPVYTLPVMTRQEMQQLRTWNDTATEYPADKTIVDLFEEQVAKTPDNIAVVFEKQQLTYRELNRKANQLARYLLNLKKGCRNSTDDFLIAIAVERSPEMVIGLLAVFKAGAAYLPIDPNYPAARIRYMLDDSAAPLLLTQSRLKARLPLKELETECVTVCLDEVDVSELPGENPTIDRRPEDLAYVIYTSGSTGEPKGVMVEHQALALHSQAILQQYMLNEKDRVLQFASFSFDTSLEQLLVAWLSGASSVLVKTNLIAAQDLSSFLQNQAVTVADLPPAYWRQMLELDTTAQVMSNLRTLILGGEALPTRLAQRTVEFFPALTCFNAYGPTEAVITPATYRLPLIVSDNTTYIAVGRPRANTRIYILDTQNHPQPPGIPGELCIAGAGLARGYLNRPELTAEKFIEVELFDRTERIYKTGDLARWLPDGNLEYLGRIDHQIKLRGFRIELGEIETALTKHEAVDEAVVVLHEQEDNKSLAAYLTMPGGAENDAAASLTAELRGFLKESLPDYMVPSSFSVLEKLPLTPNGKIDRLLLSQLSVNSDQLSYDAFVAPRTSEEKLLAGIWKNVLNLESIGVYDDFFELGGHSLLASQLVSRICKTFAIELPLHYLFQSPTIAGIAQAIDQAHQADKQRRTTFRDLRNEAVLDPLIQTSQSSPSVPVGQFAKPKGIFLTGATGFLGTYLLYELLEQTTVEIYCLSRSFDVETAYKRLRSRLESYSLWQEKYRNRIIPIIGDLSKPFIGFSEQQFGELSEQLDVIYHNGAWVNHIYPYTVLKATNVLGTQEVLRLAVQSRIKPVHFVSTFFSIPTLAESDSIEQSQLIDGYVETKWVAEDLVKQAGERGLPVCIYRPSRVTGHSQTGISNLNDILSLLIKGCIQLRKAPSFDWVEEYLTPVDYVSRAIVYLSQQPKQLGKSFDLIHSHSPIRWHDLLFNKLRALGYPLEQISYATWRTELSHQTKNALYPLLPLFSQDIYLAGQKNAQEAAFDYRDTIGFNNTFEGLADTDIVCPQFNNELVNKYLSYFLNSGFLGNS